MMIMMTGTFNNSMTYKNKLISDSFPLKHKVDRRLWERPKTPNSRIPKEATDRINDDDRL